MLDGETITNEQILKMLGWTQEPYEDEYTDGPLMMWVDPKCQKCGPLRLPDYINNTDLALTLEIEEAPLTIERITSLWNPTEWEVTFDHPEYSHTVYGEILSQAICLAWYQLSEVLFHHED